MGKVYSHEINNSEGVVSTWIVLPNYQAIIYGIEAIEITARKMYLIQEGKRTTSCFYSTKDIIGKYSISELIAKIINNAKK